MEWNGTERNGMDWNGMKAAETAGNIPQRLFFPKREEPSARIAAEALYFPL